jgi:hypothetical protein
MRGDEKWGFAKRLLYEEVVESSEYGKALPLPMGEVAEHSEDGEGKLNGFHETKPSQSPAVTALPKGEPRWIAVGD